MIRKTAITIIVIGLAILGLHQCSRNNIGINDAIKNGIEGSIVKHDVPTISISTGHEVVKQLANTYQMSELEKAYGHTIYSLCNNGGSYNDFLINECKTLKYMDKECGQIKKYTNNYALCMSNRENSIYNIADWIDDNERGYPDVK